MRRTRTAAYTTGDPVNLCLAKLDRVSHLEPCANGCRLGFIDERNRENAWQQDDDVCCKTFVEEVLWVV